MKRERKTKRELTVCSVVSSRHVGKASSLYSIEDKTLNVKKTFFHTKSIDLSYIPVNKRTNSRLGWTTYSDLYEIVHPSLVLISLYLLTGA